MTFTFPRAACTLHLRRAGLQKRVSRDANFCGSQETFDSESKKTKREQEQKGTFPQKSAVRRREQGDPCPRRHRALIMGGSERRHHRDSTWGPCHSQQFAEIVCTYMRVSQCSFALIRCSKESRPDSKDAESPAD